MKKSRKIKKNKHQIHLIFIFTNKVLTRTQSWLRMSNNKTFSLSSEKRTNKKNKPRNRKKKKKTLSNKKPIQEQDNPSKKKKREEEGVQEGQ